MALPLQERTLCGLYVDQFLKPGEALAMKCRCPAITSTPATGMRFTNEAALPPEERHHVIIVVKPDLCQTIFEADLCLDLHPEQSQGAELILDKLRDRRLI